MLQPETIKAIAVCAVFLFAVMGCIIMALLDHQRKMAELLRADRQQGNGLDERVDALQNEIRDLKSLVASQVLDRPGTDELKQRIG